ncbi:phosphoglycerate mutase-like protein [Durotheca rogersii]|uniref:phosphoglycerate mutase-like protein n=1 Tax=Durotheca rogersii TaxID=419775 RepID=UPI00221FC37C|nr:phosphoglycerate mutase-like protein [Durotheca rogersii]KAI5860304.1 phosphoglycerate mutase-like protein [Durotheca rogersii]
MPSTKSFTYQAVPGFFRHDNEPTGPQFRATTQPSLGLIDRSYETDSAFDPEGKKTQWERFVHFLEQQNRAGRGGVLYKLVFVIRHGEGHHNVKEAEVGRHAWDAHWSLLDGDGRVTWSDAKLTEKGKQQAQVLNAFLRESVASVKMPTPQTYYTSPLARCLETTRIAYSGLDLPADRPFVPIVKEGLRERYGEHTCDRRSTRSWIASSYPQYVIEPSLTEDDELWKPDRRETAAEVVDRVKHLLDDIFTHDDKHIISFTAHSGLIRGLYEAVQHNDVWVSAGALVPVLVRAERVGA